MNKINEKEQQKNGQKYVKNPSNMNLLTSYRSTQFTIYHVFYINSLFLWIHERYRIIQKMYCPHH